MINQLFIKYLVQMELFLNSNGYFKNSAKTISTDNYKENFDVEYIGNKPNRRLNIAYTIWNDGDIMLSTFMYVAQSDSTYFSLTNFLKNHKLEHRITSKLPSGGAFEPFVKKYFEDLKLLFENELNDQITGKTFENHMDALRKSMDEY